MAQILRNKNKYSNARGEVNQAVVNATLDRSGIMTSEVNKAWRALILAHRAAHSKDTIGLAEATSKVITSSGDFHIAGIGTSGQAVVSGGRNSELNSDINEVGTKNLKRKSTQSNSPNGLRFNIVEPGQPILESKVSYGEDGIATADTKVHDDLMAQKPQNDIIIYNISESPYQKVIIQNRPSKLEFRGETSWASIKSFGRNTPMYHFTGSEDVIQFNISWFCNDPNNPDEVVNKCRFLEAWTKSNGYKAAPPILQIQWGSGDIFAGHYYILTSATYTLQNFNNGYRKFSTVNGKKQVEVVDGKLYPSSATQELIFKRVSAYNLEYDDILPQDKIPNGWQS